MIAGTSLLCGGALALAFSGEQERRSPLVTAEPMAALPTQHEPVAAPAHVLDVPMSLASASQSISIEMYSATWCQACQAAHRWMDAEHIAYHVIDVDHHSGAIAQLSMLNPRRTLPTFDVDGQVLVGFDQTALTSAIDGAARRHR